MKVNKALSILAALLLTAAPAYAQTLVPARATPITGGPVAHDGAAGGFFPLLIGCFASAAAPSDVSADNDATRAWCLRNGALVFQPSFAGVLWSTGNGTAGTGTPRVTIASDNTAFSVNANAGTNLNTSALALETTLGGVLTSANYAAAFGTAGTADTQVMSVQGIAGMTKLLVTPDSVALPANQSVNVAQVNGATAVIATNSLNTTGAGLQAQALVGQCDDTSPTALTENSFGHARINCTTHAQLVELVASTATIGALTANQTINTAQINGVTPLMGNGVTGTGSQRVTIASDNTAFSVNVGTVGTSVTPGTAATNLGKAEDAAHTTGDVGVMALAVRTDVRASLTGATAEYAPLQLNSLGDVRVETASAANGNAIISCTDNAFLNMTTATTTQIVALSGSTIIYVCSFSIVSNGGTATTVTFVDGTGTNCATSQSSRSAGMPLTAATNTVGIARGSGQGMILKTSTAGDALCVTSSGAATIGVDISYAQF